MKKQIFILSIFTLLFIGFSCTERINIDLNSGTNNRLVVEGGITDQQIHHKVKLTRTTDYFVNELPPAENGAVLSISDGTNTFPMTEIENTGIYQTDSVVGQAGKTYTLDIKLADGSTYSASSLMRPIGAFDSIATIFEQAQIPGVPEKVALIKVQIYAQEPATPGDYYIWDLYLNNVLDSDTLQEKAFTDDLAVNGSYISGLDIFYILPEDLPQTDTVDIKVAMSAISKEEFNHHQAIMFETVFRGGPFETPPANIPTNITGGALGFFSANATSYAEKQIVLSEFLSGL